MKKWTRDKKMPYRHSNGDMVIRRITVVIRRSMKGDYIMYGNKRVYLSKS